MKPVLRLSNWQALTLVLYGTCFVVEAAFTIVSGLNVFVLPPVSIIFGCPWCWP